MEVAPLYELPYEDGSFNLVVLWDVIASMRPYDRSACLREVRRVLSGGGRCLTIEPAERGGLGALFSKRSVDHYYRSSGGSEAALHAEGFRSIRRLAERDDLAFVEGMNPQP